MYDPLLPESSLVSATASRGILFCMKLTFKLRLRSRYLMAKYFAKLISYGDQHRSSSYVRNWSKNNRLKIGMGTVPHANDNENEIADGLARESSHKDSTDGG
ncbi:hypothetical protein TNCV_4385551 [Trichonephila clavipes]|nr:hypothetical protein TNCV_4385551 [Trichonephila clavipes]